MTQIIEQNTEHHGEQSSASSLSTAPKCHVSAPEASRGSPFPSPVAEDQTPTHLAGRARFYVEAVSSANTSARLTPPTGSISQPGADARTSLPSPHPQTVDLYITACASGAVERGAKANLVSTIERRVV